MSQERLNELTRAEWLKYSVSIWYDIKWEKEEKTLKEKHPAIFPLDVPKRLIKTFTHKLEWVLDPFVGTGTTLVACKVLGRNGIGIDISPEYIEIAKERIAKQVSVSPSPTRQIVICDDSRNLLNHVEKESIDFVITSPPYWKIQRQEKTFLKKEATPYTAFKEDLGNIEDYWEFLKTLTDIFSKVYEALKPNKFLVVDLMDVRIGDIFYPMHVDFYEKMKEVGFVLWDLIIWDRHKEYNNLSAMIYPYKFYVNKVHEYLLIFHKPEKQKKAVEPVFQPATLPKEKPRNVPPTRKEAPFSLSQCIGCTYKASSYCWKNCPYNIWKKQTW